VVQENPVDEAQREANRAKGRRFYDRHLRVQYKPPVYLPEKGIIVRGSGKLKGQELGGPKGGSKWKLRWDGRTVSRDRLVWFLETGAWPPERGPGTLIHINSDQLDDRFINLAQRGPEWDWHAGAFDERMRPFETRRCAACGLEKTRGSYSPAREARCKSCSLAVAPSDTEGHKTRRLRNKAEERGFELVGTHRGLNAKTRFRCEKHGDFAASPALFMHRVLPCPSCLRAHQTGPKPWLKKTDEEKAEATRRRRRKYEAAPKNKAARQMRTHLTRCMRNAKAGKTFARCQELLGYTLEEYMTHMEGLFDERMSWQNAGRGGWHVGHRIPVDWYLTNGVNDPKVINALSNVFPQWERDNYSQGARLHHIGPLFEHGRQAQTEAAE